MHGQCISCCSQMFYLLRKNLSISLSLRYWFRSYWLTVDIRAVEYVSIWWHRRIIVENRANLMSGPFLGTHSNIVCRLHTSSLPACGQYICHCYMYSVAGVDVYCQAWLRMCFNGCDLQCYLSLIINDAAQLRSVSHWILVFLIADLKCWYSINVFCRGECYHRGSAGRR